MKSGLVFARGTPPEASYLFKHALVQDAAYGSLLRSRRQGLHRRITATLEERFPEITQAQPALLARHCAAAGLMEKAVSYWLKAGQQSLGRSAMLEADAQLRRGLDVLALLPDDPWRRQKELDLQVAHVSALTATRGWAGAEVAETTARARTLAEQLDRPECLVPLVMGQFGFHHARSEHGPALALGEQLEQIGEARNDAVAQLLGRVMHGATRFWLGEFIAARAVLERCVGPFDSPYRAVERLSPDPHTTGLIYLAITLTCLGYVDQARSRLDEAVSEARRLGHVHNLVTTLHLADWTDWLTRSPMVHVEECLSLSTEHGFPFYSGWALAFHGGSLIAVGQAREGLALVTQGQAVLRAAGVVLSMALMFTWLAEACAMLGRSAEERSYVAEAAQIVETTEERYLEAELLHRVPGDLLNTSGDQSGAERHYRQAIAVAERQSAKLFQLRASVSLARLWRDQGKRSEARDLLSPIYHWFTEGFDAPDLRDAKALLDELS